VAGGKTPRGGSGKKTTPDRKKRKNSASPDGGVGNDPQMPGQEWVTQSDCVGGRKGWGGGIDRAQKTIEVQGSRDQKTKDGNNQDHVEKKKFLGSR